MAVDTKTKSKGRAGNIVAVTMIAVGVVTAAVGGSLYPPLDNYPVILLWGLGVGLGLAVLFLPVAWLVARRSEGGPSFLRLARAGAIGLLLLGVGLLVLFNGLLDPNPRAVERVEVLETLVDHRRSRLFVRDFRPGREGERLAVPMIAGMSGRVGPGDEVIVVAGPGLLAWWRDEVRWAE